MIVIDSELKPHPKQKQNAYPDPKEPVKPAYGPHNRAKPTTEKKTLGPQTRQAKTADGKPLAVVEGDIPGLDFLSAYIDEKITDADYDSAAKKLGCESEVIKAIAKQETGKLEALGLGAFDKHNRPTILYERHIFSSITGRIYDKKYPDLSSRNPYLAGTAKDKKGGNLMMGNITDCFRGSTKS